MYQQVQQVTFFYSGTQRYFLLSTEKSIANTDFDGFVWRRGSSWFARSLEGLLGS